MQLCSRATLLHVPLVLTDGTSQVKGLHAAQPWLDSYFQETRPGVTVVAVIGGLDPVAAVAVIGEAVEVAEVRPVNTARSIPSRWECI